MQPRSIALIGILFMVVAGGLVAAWAWLGAPVEMPQPKVRAGEKLHCLSYAPFRAGQNPFGPDVPLDPRQIEEDLRQLKEVTDCVRTYSVDHGLDRIAQIAKTQNMKVLQGLWLSSIAETNRKQVTTAIALAEQFPDVIAGVIVGNEVLLRGEMGAPELVGIIREVKTRVTAPVTYADVWEFWLAHQEVASAVDFITVHILPYWEDFPIPADAAASHVDAIRKRMAAAFPGKDILIGEFGWPSAGRMRDGALPSRVNQARAIQEVVALARRENYALNLIEAYDQPWKRQLEGTVGGHWGLFDAYDRHVKFEWGRPVSNHPHWRGQAAAAVAFLFVVVGLVCIRRGANRASAGMWLRVATLGFVSASLMPWTMTNVPLESLTRGDWLRSLAWAAMALLAPLFAAVALPADVGVPSCRLMLSRGAPRPLSGISWWLGLALIGTGVLAVQAALGLVFDPRYRDFPFAPLTGAAVALALATGWEWRPAPLAAEGCMAATIGACALYIVFNEGIANWQALWFAGALVLLALTLVQVRDAPSSK
ncbi:MAG: beta-(1-6) glucans synthase [Xanthobacteraceae bacterium]